ncbi:hypothetical protein NA56DRAFT_646968 [Hyaloscypha hepaticicola]|uniref:Uncharacterized protein n=1 Tax=Hyaloscypha hepaticicola TaxID=2082293 RepID=A0A2J6Q036_9HELO|nr:hypothetical protein NA56DRAFT_646968 [Hyaloscypha hepaticicola]
MSMADDLPDVSDYEYDDHYSSIPEEDWYPSDEQSDVQEFFGRIVDNSVDMGEAIALVFPDLVEHDVNDDEDMFDDGLDGDESEDSDASTNYEELTEPDVVLTVVEVPAEDRVNEVGEDMVSDDSADESYKATSDEESLAESDSEQMRYIVENVAEQSEAPVPPLEETALDRLLGADAKVKQGEKKRDASHWRLLELQEILRNTEREISEAEEAFQAISADLNNSQTERIAQITASGLSVELYESYRDFCESLHPEFGLREGLSITCDQPHNGSYFHYDPELYLFKENVEMDYSTCNFRCEAGKEPALWSRSRDGQFDDVVNFWPIKSPEPRIGFEKTWGEQYPVLYRLAIQAAKNASDAAREMLMRLPSPDSPLSGWMFEYQPEAPLAIIDEPSISRRWTFKEARKIEAPMIEEEKRQLVESLLAA